MSEMIERAAIAWLRDLGSEAELNKEDPYRRLISYQLSTADLLGAMRAAIKAMREPTEAMAEAPGVNEQYRLIDEHYGNASARGLYRAMIDAALAEP